jgi:hypothetical protein
MFFFIFLFNFSLNVNAYIYIYIIKHMENKQDQDQEKTTKTKEEIEYVLSQIEAEGVTKVKELLIATSVLTINDTVFGNALVKIMADGCQEFMNQTGRTGITYSELRQLYG